METIIMKRPVFDHGKEVIGKILGIDEDRMREIMTTAQTEMIKEKPNGHKSEFLEKVIEQCLTIEEIITTTLAWNTMMNQMHLKELDKQRTSAEFAEKMGVKPFKIVKK